jgi:hypothetical protein
MLPSTEQLVQQIHDSPTRIVLAATGGGSRAIADLLDVPGGSRTLLEAVVPYSTSALAAWLGSQPEEACSAATARAMAMVAFLRARQLEQVEVAKAGAAVEPKAGVAVQLAPQQQTVELAPQQKLDQIELPLQQSLAGVACTASLATDRPKHGPHRIHVALQTAVATSAWWLQLQKDRRTRTEEERLAGQLVLNVVAEACGVSERLKLDLLEGEQVQVSRSEAPQAWQDLLAGKVESVRAGRPGAAPRVIFPGAFNPLHVGHRRMMQVAQDMLQQPVAMEISIVNVDKPPLDFAEIERRLGQFSADEAVYLTRAATFEEKSRLFPEATFVVGTDTLRRIADPRYYGGDRAACQSAVERIAGRACRFLVFGRNLGVGFVRLADLDLPDSLRAICREVLPEVFREDISSTSLRKSGTL